MKNWKSWAPLALFAIFLAWILGAFRLPKETDMQAHAFGRIPVVEKGRHQPFDSFARNALMLQQGRNVADVAYFYGEEAPLTGLFSDRRIDVPRANAYDFVNAGPITAGCRSIKSEAEIALMQTAKDITLRSSAATS